jgi:nucleotide-binding universal stress UspA family protein
MIRSLLVAVDSSAHAKAALEHAVGLAGTYKARITGLNVLDVRYVEMPPYLDYAYSFEAVPLALAPLDLMEKFRDKGERMLADLRQKVEAAGIPVDTRIEEGVPGQVIADLANEHDLVVLGKRGEHAKWGRDLLGSTAEAVTKRSLVPVLLVEEVARPLHKVLVMFDGSEPATRALRLAVDLSTSAKVELTVFTAHDDAGEGQTVLNVARAYLESLELAATYVSLPGKPSRAASAALADHAVDLVVMGTRGHSAIYDLILGRTAEQLMRSVQTPVLLVP